MENPNIIFIGGVILMVLIITFRFYFSKKAIIKRKLRKAPHKRIYHFRNGEIAKFTGKVEAIEKPLIAPLSKRKCSYYTVIVERKKSTGKSSHWKTIIEETKAHKYVIRDSSACAFINSKHINKHIVFDKEYSSGFFNDASEELEKYLRQYGHESENMLGFNKNIRYKEGILEENEKVAVLGQGKWMDAETLGLPAEYGRVLSISSYESPIYLSDDPDTTVRNPNRVPRM